jgi:flagellar hook assembly protein FlgD
MQSRVRLPLLAAPNPFAQRTTFRYTLEQAGALALDICNSADRLVRRLNNGIASPGTHEAVWAGLDAAGRNAPEGIYFCRLSAGGITASVKLIKSAN